MDLIAPTSDYVSFCVAEAIEKIGDDAPDVGHPSPRRSGRASSRAGSATLCEPSGSRRPDVAGEHARRGPARCRAEIGYPVVLKPRSHVGIGMHRGVVVRDAGRARPRLPAVRVGERHAAALRHVPDLSMPLIQRYCEQGTVDVISLSGCLDRDGSVLALDHSRKVSQAPRRFGVGTMFEPVRRSQPFTPLRWTPSARSSVPGSSSSRCWWTRSTGEHWAIDLNPRGFGQMSLDIALGNDLPRIWYESVTGRAAPPLDAPAEADRRRSGTTRSPPTSGSWCDSRAARIESALVRHTLGRLQVTQGGGGIRLGRPAARRGLRPRKHLRHPRAFLRQFLFDTRDLVVGSSQCGDGRPWPRSLAVIRSLGARCVER